MTGSTCHRDCFVASLLAMTGAFAIYFVNNRIHIISSLDTMMKMSKIHFMEITRQADYAIRCLLFMAKNPKKVFMVKDLAYQKLIPRSFLAKILQRLAKAGLVKSIRGVKGGFMLAKPPAEISIFKIVESIDGPIQMNKCVLDSHLCSENDTCASHPLWMQLQEHVTGKLKKATLQNLKTPEPKN